MAMAWLWTGMVAVSLIFGALTGNLNALSAAALEGAQSAVELCLAMCGVMCLWTGVMEVMNQCHLTDRLASLFRPLLKRLLPNASRDSETLAAISANLSADLLGLGNAATPLGIRAACRMSRGCKGTASDELCLLVVLNTASIQLLPTTLAGVRASLGAAMALSTLIVPVLLTFTACFALGKRVDVYSALTKGAEEGLTVLLHILPSLIALLSAVYMFRASGAMEALGALLAPALDKIGIPAETAPLLFIRPISGSGALAVGSEIMDSYGVDSYVGRVAAVMLGSSETTFYTVAVYYGAAGITKTRYTIPAALCADVVMFLASAFFVRLLMDA